MSDSSPKSSPLIGKPTPHYFSSSGDVGVVVLLVAIFGTDLFVRFTNGENNGIDVFYVLPGLLSLWLSRRHAPMMVAWASSTLMVLGLALGRLGPERIAFVEDLTTVAVCLFAVWVTAYLSLWRRAVEAEVEAHRDTIATTLSSIADAVITTDSADHITFMNPSACNATGWSAKRALGRPLHEVFRVEDEDGEPVLDPIPHGKPQQFVLTSKHGTRVHVEATSAMVRDTDPDHLGRKRGQVLVFRDVSERVRQHAEVERLAYRDTLTGLPNRAAFFERADLELAHARRDDGSVALLFLDLDGFKKVNDTHGHQAGDHLLQVVASRMRECLREVDTVARLAGDEFTVLLPGVDSRESALKVADKLLLAVGSPIDLPGAKVRVTPSIGIALYPSDALDREDLLQRADAAMYAAKSGGGFRAVCHEGGSFPTGVESSDDREREVRVVETPSFWLER